MVAVEAPAEAKAAGTQAARDWAEPSVVGSAARVAEEEMALGEVVTEVAG